jgi:hypothetical protein
MARNDPTDEPDQARTVRGVVVDERGRPAAHATVAVGNLLRATTFDLGSPLSNSEGRVHIATADEAGHFTVTAPAHTGTIVAERTGQRSTPVALADRVQLVLHPTRWIAGKVDMYSR